MTRSRTKPGWKIHLDTVYEYTHLLQETHIVRLLRPFVGGKRAEITSTPKVYFINNGIRNILFGGFQPVHNRTDHGALWENFAFTEIYKSINPVLDSIGYWRSKAGAEVDFIIQHQGRIAACEIKAGDSRGKITRGSKSFIDAYQPELFVAVSSVSHPSIRLGKTEARFIPLFELGKAIREWIA